MANQIRMTPDMMRGRANEYRNEADAVNGVISKMDSSQQSDERMGRCGKRSILSPLSRVEAWVYESGRAYQRNRRSP